VRLDRVTITGADDSVAPQDLIALSERYPFVEWGILFSGSRNGCPRYPSRTWVETLHNAVESRAGHTRLSAHLCGQWVRDLVMNGTFTWEASYGVASGNFGRVQLNFHSERQVELHPDFRLATLIQGLQWILQMDGTNDVWASHLMQRPGAIPGQFVPLFDVSGGAGQLPGRWPAALPEMYCGYAGGLSPDNLSVQLPLIEYAARDSNVWIDVETHVRSNNDTTFDLEKVERFLEIAAPWVRS
jgi:hypothetical protein